MNNTSKRKTNLIERLILEENRRISGPRYNRTLGFFIRSMQIPVFVFFLIIILVLYIIGQDSERFLGAVVILLLMWSLTFILKLLEPWVVKLRLSARTMTTSRAHHILKRRPKDYVLYLRSFQDDDNSIDETSFEERLCRALQWLGPVIAIGQPKERNIPRGAARFYFHGHEWKEIALDLMENARLVAIRMGQTEGLWWEIEQILNHGKSIPILFIFSSEKDFKIKEKLFEILETRDPKYWSTPIENFDFIFCEPGVYIKVMTREDDKYQMVEQKVWSIEESIRKVYEHFGIKLPARLSFEDRVRSIFQISGLILFVDQFSKYLVRSVFVLDHNPIVASNFLNFILVWNRGVSFGMFANQSLLSILILNGMAIVALIFLFVWCCRIPPYKRLNFNIERIGMSCVIGGALGNIADRFLYGAVVEFIDLHYSGYHWPAFNIADFAISIGAILMIFSIFSRRI